MTAKEIRDKRFRIFRRRGSLKAYIAQGGFDGVFLALLMIILTVGIVMMFSASYVYSWYERDDPYFYFKRQLIYTAVSLVVMFIVSRIRFDVFEDAAFLALIAAVAILIYVLINPKIIPGKEDFKRWIEVPLFGTFQPSEFAKIAIIMYCAWSMDKRRRLVESNWWATVPHLGVIAVVAGLVYAENHLSGTILVLAIGVIMIFLGGSKMQIFAIGFAAIVVFGIYAAASGYLKDYMGERIEVWQKLLKNEELTDKEVQTEGWQILQSLYAIGSGGAFGMGFGKSNQKHLYLPEPQNDFIYAIVCEELGFIRALIIMILFVLLVLRGIHIALRCKSRFAALLTLGISFQIGLEAGLNMAVVTGTVPNTGISLPFFSYGGSAMLMLLTEMGMILSVSRSIEKKPAKEIVINEQS